MGLGVPAKKIMQCVICREGETRPGFAVVTLTREALTLVVKGVPADICENRGEEYVDDTVAAQLLATLEEAALAGVQVDVREYVAA